MHICYISTAMDMSRGGSMLSLLSSLTHIKFTIITNYFSDISGNLLPDNIEIIEFHEKLGTYYFGIADAHFVTCVFNKYPPSSIFWKQFDVIHLNQTINSRWLELQDFDHSLLYTVHHPVSADRQVSMQEVSNIFFKVLWYFKYFSLIQHQKKLLRRVKNILTVSQTSRERIVSDYGINREKISVVYNGVDTNFYFFSKLVALPKYSLISVGSFIHPRKGFKYLLSLYRFFSSAGFLVADVGKRNPKQLEELRKIKGVEVFGIVDNSRLRELLWDSSCFVSTSLYEGFGLGIVEALACGRPAFSFDSGAVSEVLAKIDSSLIVEQRNVSDLANAITNNLNLSIEIKNKLGDFYFKKVQEHYPLHSTAVGLEQVYLRIRS